MSRGLPSDTTEDTEIVNRVSYRSGGTLVYYEPVGHLRLTPLGSSTSSYVTPD